MDNAQQENIGGEPPVPADQRDPRLNPPGSFTAFLGLAAAGYVVMLLFVFAFGLYGDALTAGVDQACAEAAFQNGKQVEAKGNYELAIQRYHQALEGYFPDKSREYECARSIGEVLLRLGRYEDAIDAYRALAPDAFRSAGHWTGYVTALFRAGHYDEADAVGKQWLEKAQAEKDAQQLIWANTILGQTGMNTGRLDEALGYFRAAAALAPETDAGILIARVLQEQGKREEAIRQLDTFLNLVKSGPLHEEAARLRTQLIEPPPSS
jgi:tetratricopeptide (TPR) repeat protein